MLRGSVPSVNSRAQHTFSRAPQAGIPRSSFNRTFSVKTTFNEGYLVPILADEIRDKFVDDVSVFAIANYLKKNGSLNTSGIVKLLGNVFKCWLVIDGCG